MRSRIASCAVAALLAGAAPFPAEAGNVFGARAGVSIATADVETSALFDDDNRTGFAGTAFLQLGADLFALQPEVSYIQKGVGDVALDYVEAAALVKIGLPILPQVTPHAFAGIGADYQVDESTTLDIDTEELDWNAIFGADVFISLGTLSLVADVRYAVGLKDIRDTGDAFDEIKNRAWLLSAGIGLNF